MSQEELRQQHETINTIAKQIAIMIKWWPVIAAAGGFIIAIGSAAIAGYKYDDNLVKKVEYAKLIRAVDRISTSRANDSVAAKNGFIAINKKLDSVILTPRAKRRQVPTRYFTAITGKSSLLNFNLSIKQK
ncbi:MAG: hypothetical protein V4553_13090 [Bacteroidota bacterium]